MIKKLEPLQGLDHSWLNKINELVDAVNNQQIQLNNHECRLLDLHNRVTVLDDPTYHEEPAENPIISKMENVAENGNFAKNAQDHRPNMVMDDPFGPHPNIYEQGRPTDPYAEQRKWVGKLCKFWFADAEHPTFGILDFVDAGLHPEPFHTDCGESEQGWYPHCEPVKPDDDIIYKGE